MSYFNVYDELKEAIEKDCINNVSFIDENVLPYKADFLADPFIYCIEGSYHILCEVYVRKGDKRITHIRSDDDMKTWKWVSDLITGMDLSFPALYNSPDAMAGEVIVIPQISKEDKLIGFFYNLNSGSKAEKIWEVEMKAYTNDHIIINRPGTDKSYMFYCSRNMSKYFRQTGLYISEIEGHLKQNSKPVLKKNHVLKLKTLSDLILKIFKKPRLSYRPAGNILKNDKNVVVIPIQAKKTDKYGELLAFVSVKWEKAAIIKTEFFNIQKLYEDIERSHHISWTKRPDNTTLFCYDFIRTGNGEKWELGVFETNTNKMN